MCRIAEKFSGTEVPLAKVTESLNTKVCIRKCQQRGHERFEFSHVGSRVSFGLCPCKTFDCFQLIADITFDARLFTKAQKDAFIPAFIEAAFPCVSNRVMTPPISHFRNFSAILLAIQSSGNS